MNVAEAECSVDSSNYVKHNNVITPFYSQLILFLKIALEILRTNVQFIHKTRSVFLIFFDTLSTTIGFCVLQMRSPSPWMIPVQIAYYPEFADIKML